MEDVSSLVLCDAAAFLLRHGSYDIAFLDPPYHKELIAPCLERLTDKMNADGVIICETARDEVLPPSVNGWSVTKEKNYGKTKLTYYRKDHDE